MCGWTGNITWPEPLQFCIYSHEFYHWGIPRWIYIHGPYSPNYYITNDLVSVQIKSWFFVFGFILKMYYISWSWLNYTSIQLDLWSLKCGLRISTWYNIPAIYIYWVCLQVYLNLHISLLLRKAYQCAMYVDLHQIF